MSSLYGGGGFCGFRTGISGDPAWVLSGTNDVYLLIKWRWLWQRQRRVVTATSYDVIIVTWQGSLDLAVELWDRRDAARRLASLPVTQYHKSLFRLLSSRLILRLAHHRYVVPGGQRSQRKHPGTDGEWLCTDPTSFPTQNQPWQISKAV